MNSQGQFGPLAERVQRLRALHVPGRPLVLPNAWDAASARLVEAAGFQAVATASSAVSASLGYRDEEGTPAGEMFESVSCSLCPAQMADLTYASRLRWPESRRGCESNYAAPSAFSAGKRNLGSPGLRPEGQEAR